MRCMTDELTHSSLGSVSSELTENEPDFLPAVSSLDSEASEPASSIYSLLLEYLTLEYSSSNSVADCYTAVTI